MYALAPIVYNVGIIVGIVVLYPRYQILGLAYGVVLGAAMHCLIQLPAVLHTGFRYVWSWRLQTPGVGKILRQMPARALALGVVQLNAIVIAAYALRLESGSLTIWQWADNLQNVPINVFGVSLALSAFPVFSQAFAEKDLIKFKTIFSQNFRRLLFVIVPISVAVLLLRAQFVRLILGSFGAGQFDWDATIVTAQVLGIFAVVMFAQATIPMLVRSFFAHHDTSTTVLVSLCSVLLNAGLAWSLADRFGIYGLAAAFAFSSLLQMLALLVILRIKFGDLDDNAIIRSLWRIVLAAVAMGVVIQGMKYFIAPVVDMRTVFGLAVQTLGSVLAGGGVYLFIAYFGRFPEIDIIRSYLHKLKAVL
jgi:putative peptidoglycan lipid II flippase